MLPRVGNHLLPFNSDPSTDEYSIIQSLSAGPGPQCHGEISKSPAVEEPSERIELPGNEDGQEDGQKYSTERCPPTPPTFRRGLAGA
jgi:hypothetical protein